MENVEAESKDEAMRGSKTAIRCAKAAFLLSSLKSSQNRQLRATAHEQAKERKMLRKTVGDLKIQLARERLRNKRIKLCGLMEFVLQLLLVISLSSLSLFVAFKFV
ncbi:hypothetical protein IC582_006977 [Cucumis melo]|uniref:Retrotransposon-derived protein PEG10 n=2 Tax=Cucumis melo TaxID=3656 RepID=A0A5D3E7E0_CUCMM|nr:uncharacterized protein LOC127149012 [Cucumis melo]KAA0038606.1 putative Retrotransposon-derived protein PEG10 [Cucumis melo var. makuwa]TYK31205.1 putative Retrotransposon-derived protein PEG10 [Cucumis melo var. makuwa]